MGYWINKEIQKKSFRVYTDSVFTDIRKTCGI